MDVVLFELGYGQGEAETDMAELKDRSTSEGKSSSACIRRCGESSSSSIISISSISSSMSPRSLEEAGESVHRYGEEARNPAVCGFCEDWK